MARESMYRARSAKWTGGEAIGGGKASGENAGLPEQAWHLPRPPRPRSQFFPAWRDSTACPQRLNITLTATLISLS